MPNPLHLFIHPPFSDWTLVFTYGAEQPEPPTGPVIHNHLRLQTTGTGALFAAANGTLSVHPPIGGILDPSEQIDPPASGDPLPSTINLFLHLSPLVVRQPTFRAQASQVDNITGFAYLNVETASLEAALAELLDNAIIPTGSLTRAQVVDLLVRGMLDVEVTTGHALGNAATQGTPAGSRQVGFTTLTDYGPIDPSYIYDLMRDFVADSQSDLDDFLTLAPKSWPVIEASLSTDNAINLTQLVLYPMSVLQNLHTSRDLSATQWRQVGDYQKRLWRNRLLSRVGHAPAGSTDPTFEFDNMDQENIFQLEAVTEFYMNFSDPWLPGPPWTEGANVPREPLLSDGTPNPAYLTVDFLDPAGTAATVTAAGNVVQLDGNPDLTRVRKYYNFATGNMECHDSILLESDTASATHMYSIIDIDNNAHTVTVNGKPVLTGGSSAWKINLRPVLVLIDSFGPRDQLRGTSATVASSSTANVLTLDGPPDLTKVNKNFDTIYLPSDTARASRTYRIVDVDNPNHTVTLDGTSNLDNGTSIWHIPAGISGELPPLDYKLDTGGTRGFDHYDGVLFLLQNGTVRTKFRWSSFTSHDYPVGGQNLSSLRGNLQYDFSSFRSPHQSPNPSDPANSGPRFRNYCFSIVDAGANYDGVRNARFYFSTPVTDDSTAGDPTVGTAGKKDVRIHRGTRNDTPTHPGSGSAGCLVSPNFFDLRNWLIALYEEEYEAINGPGMQDAEVMKAFGTDALCQTLWDNTTANTGPAAQRLTDTNWNSKIVGSLWVIRPDERPLG